jgi:hypothetical protein
MNLRPQEVDSIYLNKRGNEQNTQHWAYYRVTSLGGGYGDHIQVCMLKWHSLSDIDIVGDEDKALVVNPADTGFGSAFPNLSMKSSQRRTRQ